MNILLILETDADLRYWDRLQELIDALDENGVSIQLWRIGPDEIERPMPGSTPGPATSKIKHSEYLSNRFV